MMNEQTPVPVSVYIITKDEEENIRRVLQNLQDFAEVIVVDSGSSDRTVAIAESFPNTNVSFHAWQGFSAQKSHALSLCSHDWVLNLDADETISDEYRQAVRDMLAQDNYVALRSIRLLYRWGRRPRSFGGPEKLIRFFRKDCGSYESRQVHESISIRGAVKDSTAAILHHENLTYSQRIEKSVFYARLKAKDKFDKGDSISFVVVLIIFPLDFIRTWLFRGHFLDGLEGVLTSINVAFYSFMKYANLWDMRRRAQRKACSKENN